MGGHVLWVIMTQWVQKSICDSPLNEQINKWRLNENIRRHSFRKLNLIISFTFSCIFSQTASFLVYCKPQSRKINLGNVCKCETLDVLVLTEQGIYSWYTMFNVCNVYNHPFSKINSQINICTNRINQRQSVLILLELADFQRIYIYRKVMCLRIIQF